jgi:predicted protein tyrosine phosphatase
VNIKIMSHQEIEQIEFKNLTTVISISSDDVFPNLSGRKNLLQWIKLEFDDSDTTGSLFTMEQAKLVKKYADVAYKAGSDIICQCEAGISRSAGLAAAISFMYNGTDTWVFENPKYFPNKHVYRTMLRAYGIYKDWFK